jgi:hypothetical protein
VVKDVLKLDLGDEFHLLGDFEIHQRDQAVEIDVVIPIADSAVELAVRAKRKTIKKGLLGFAKGVVQGVGFISGLQRAEQGRLHGGYNQDGAMIHSRESVGVIVLAALFEAAVLRL